MRMPESPGRSRRTWHASLFMVAAALSFAVSPGQAVEQPICQRGECLSPVPTLGDEGGELRLAGIELSDSQRRSRIKRCCRRVEAGYPPKGYLCSYVEVRRAYREGICLPPRR